MKGDRKKGPNVDNLGSDNGRHTRIKVSGWIGESDPRPNIRRRNRKDRERAEGELRGGGKIKKLRRQLSFGPKR